MTPAPEAAPRPPRFGPDDVARLAAIAWIAVALFLYASVLSVQWSDEPAFEQRDFYCFFHAGEILNAGDDPYSRRERGFVHPPFTLPLVSALAHTGLHASYVVLAVLGALGWALGCVLTSRLGIAEPTRRATVAIAILTTPCAFLALHLGQLSGIFFVILAGTLLLWARGKEGAAGAVGALLLAKPNFAIALIGAAIVLGKRRFLGAMALGAVVLALVSLPFGTGVWADWLSALSRLAARHDTLEANYWQQLTVYGFLRSVTHGVDASGVLARVLTGLFLVGFGVAIAFVLRRHRGRFAEPQMAARLAAILVLATTALNSYLFYYDAAFLALPAGTLWLAKESWRSAGRWRVAVTCAALSWLLQLQLAFVHLSPPLSGVVTALWLAVELRDLWAAAPSALATPDTPTLEPA